MARRQNRRSRSRTEDAEAPPLPTRASIEQSALLYLGRYDASSSHLRQVLRRKVRRILDAQPPEAERGPAEARSGAWVEEVVAKVLELGLVDDQRYATAVARRLERRGTSHRAMQAKLREKGVPQEIVNEVLGGGPSGDSELVAASALARRRRLGPYRVDPEAREARRERDLAALARAGFNFDVARRIIDAEDVASLPEREMHSAFD